MNQQILKLIANRIEAGKRTYPEELDVNDGRDWIQESIESAIETLTGNYPEKVEENCDSTWFKACLLYTSPSPRDRTRSRMPSSA